VFGTDDQREVALTLTPSAALSVVERSAIRELADAVDPADEQADQPSQQLEWASPQWCVRIFGDDGRLASYIGIVLRDGQHDGHAVRIGGVGAVKTLPAKRNRGYARLGLTRAVEFLREQSKVAFGLLVCDPPLIAYYMRLGWSEYAGQLLVTQAGTATQYTFNRVMTLGLRSPAPIGGTIDLQGPPW
jgi:GNAT superfamily N-acetyltransferase